MTAFSDDGITVALEHLLSQRIVSLERIGGGRNSKVYQICCESSVQYAAKFYYQSDFYGRDRIGVEISSLQFLWDNGIGCVPKPIKMDRELGCAVYEFIDGSKVHPGKIAGTDIHDAAQFLGQLSVLTKLEQGRALPLASEACLSMKSLVENIQQRTDRLLKMGGYGGIRKELSCFLVDQFQPVFAKSILQSQKKLRELGALYDAQIPFEERTLSPSDFGFHNALRRRDGSLVFIDFEYFGWDDPAKMVSDFLLHPAQQLSVELKGQFFGSVLAHFGNLMSLQSRVAMVYPLYGLKWTLILLNEFLTEEWNRRDFANPVHVDRENIQRKQLSKARDMLIHVGENCEKLHFLP